MRGSSFACLCFLAVAAGCNALSGLGDFDFDRVDSGSTLPDGAAGAGAEAGADASGDPAVDQPAEAADSGACSTSPDTCGPGLYFDQATLKCADGCKNDQDCGAGQDASAMTCNLGTHQCVGCTDDNQCQLGTICVGQTCVPGCNQQHGCMSASTCCTATCVPTETDVNHCGSCGHSCPPIVHGTAGCAAGTCGVGTCDNGFHESSGQCVANGCASQVVAAHSHACALRTDGSMWCWGSNAYGALGINQSGGSSATPLPVSSLGMNVLSIGRTHDGTLAVKTDNTVWCWGWNGEGECGFGGASQVIVPTQNPLTAITAATGGWWHACEIGAGGSLWCAGYNQYGQVGNGATSNSVTVPTDANGLANVTDVCAGVGHTCARTSAGKAYCWGWDTYGQIGDGKVTGNVTTPYEITALGTDVAGVACGQHHSCARKSDGTVWCWGRGSSGQVGTGTTTTNNPNPTQLIAFGADAAQLSAWGDFTCARKTSGALWCWGSNSDGQLGTGSAGGQQNLPVQATVVGSDVEDVTVGLEFTCVRHSDKSLSCWGLNTAGQLGDGTTASPKTSAVKVLLPCP